jgi:hypothetical protein
LFFFFRSLATTAQVVKPKTKLMVTEKKDYPITTSFPPTLESLGVIGKRANNGLQQYESRHGIWQNDTFFINLGLKMMQD